MKRRSHLTISIGALIAELVAMPVSAVINARVADKYTGEPLPKATLKITLPSGERTEVETDEKGVVPLPLTEPGDLVRVSHPGYLAATAAEDTLQGEDRRLVLAAPDPTHLEYPEPGDLTIGFGAHFSRQRMVGAWGKETKETPDGPVTRALTGADDPEFTQKSQMYFAQLCLGLLRLRMAKAFFDASVFGRLGGGKTKLDPDRSTPTLESSEELYWGAGVNARLRSPRWPVSMLAGLETGRFSNGSIKDTEGEIDLDQLRAHLGLACVLADVSPRIRGPWGRATLAGGVEWGRVDIATKRSDMVPFERTTQRTITSMETRREVIGADSATGDVIYRTVRAPRTRTVTETEVIDIPRTVRQDFEEEESFGGYLEVGLPIWGRDMGLVRVSSNGDDWSVFIKLAKWLPFAR